MLEQIGPGSNSNKEVLDTLQSFRTPLFNGESRPSSAYFKPHRQEDLVPEFQCCRVVLRQKLDYSERRAIVKLYKEKHTIREISEKVKCSKSVVGRVVKSYNDPILKIDK